MTEHSLTIKKTKHETILQFETDHFLVNNTTFKFNRQAEADGCPLAQKLLAFSFIKAIYIAENFIGVEVFISTSWSEVQNSLYTTIKEYINSGKPVLTPGAEKKGQRIPITIYTEMTPNPGTLKFVCNTKLVLNKVQYDYNENTENAPFVEELFKFSYVKRVVIANHHILITKGGKVSWDEVTLELRDWIRRYLMRGKPVTKDCT